MCVYWTMLIWMTTENPKWLQIIDVHSVINQLRAGLLQLQHFYRAMLAQSAVMRLLSSVRLSVTFWYQEHIGWNSSEIISWPNSLRPLLWLTPNVGDLVQREHPQNWG